MLGQFMLVALCLAFPAQSAVMTLSDVDTARLQQILAPAWELQDLNSLLFAASSYKHLGIEAPNAKDACAFVSGVMDGSPTTEVIFQAASAAKYLGCSLTPSAKIKQTLGSSQSENSAMTELYHAVTAMSHLGMAIDSPKVLAMTQTVLKRDDSVLNMGYSFHIGSVLSGNVAPLYEHIEDAVVQADEVDGHMLQFEGGLSITAFVIDGAYRLCDKLPTKPMPIKPQQAVKFANYLLSRKSVQLPKSIHYLLKALATLTANTHHVPVSSSVVDLAAVSQASPTLKVSVTDLLGGAVPGGVSVTADAIVAEGSGAPIAEGVVLKQVAGGSVFELDVMALKPARGFYSLTLSSTGADKRLVGNAKTKLRFKVLSSVSLENVKFGTADVDQSSAPALKKIAYGSKMAGVVSADHHQKLVMKFDVVDNGAPTSLHQAFVRVVQRESAREIIFVAESDMDDHYKFEMSVSGTSEQFGHTSGMYSVELILGDATISNPLKWHLADVSLAFQQGDSVPAPAPLHTTFKALPEIEHLFAVAEPRPPKLVSLVFSALCLLPFLVMLVLWGKLGVNVSNFKFSLAGLGFHLGLGGMLGLFVVFWLWLNMFSTLRYLVLVGAFTFYCGNSLLSGIALRRKNEK